MPVYISDLMIEMQKARGIDVDGSTVLVVGVTYKPNVADTRESPAVDILEYLDLKGAKVFFNDPLIETVVVNGRELQSTPLNDPILGTTRFTIVITPQQSYDWQEIADSSALVLDTSNAMQRAGIIGDHIVHL